MDIITKNCVFRQLCQLVRCYVNLSDNDVDLSDNYLVICMAFTGQEHVIKIYSLANE